MKRPRKPPARKRAAPKLDDLLRRVRASGRRGPSTPRLVMPPVPPCVLPPGFKLPKPGMAMDDALAPGSAWATQSLAYAAGAGYGFAFEEGINFQGYPYLATLAQIPEYRVISETIATEMTRKWVRIQSKSAIDKAAAKNKGREPGVKQVEQETGDEVGEKIKAVQDWFETHRVRDVLTSVAELDGFFGRAHIYIDLGDDRDDREEMAAPIGDGRSPITRGKVTPDHPVRQLKVVEPVWAYPSNYNATDPLADDWYRPSEWYVMARSVHRTRFLTFIGRPVPDLWKPSYSFGGLSLSQMAKPYVDNWLSTRQAVNDLIRAFTVFVLGTDMSAINQDGGEAAVITRAQLFNAMRENLGVLVKDEKSESFENVTASLGSLDVLQAQAQEHMAAVSRIPLVKLLGIQPHGLNASSEGEIRVFYDTIGSYQERFFRPHLNTIFWMAQMSLWGEVDPDLVYSFIPLWELDEVQKATKRKTDADTDGVLIDKGVLNPEESRERIASDPDSPYASIDVEDLPEPPDPMEGEEGIGEPHEESGERDDGGEPSKPAADAEASRIVPFAGDAEGARLWQVGTDPLDWIWAPSGEEAARLYQQGTDPRRWVWALDEAQFEESKHPRDKGGKFATSASGSAGGGEFKHYKPSSSKEEHAKRVTAAVQNKAQKSSTFRWIIGKLIGEAPSFGAQESVSKLQGKIIESWELVHADLVKKGDAAQAAKVSDKLNKLWGALGGAPKSAPKAEPPKPEPAKPDPGAELKNNLKNKFIANTGGKQLLPLDKGKEIVKAAVQVGAPADVAESLMSPDEVAARKKQYGSVETAHQKGKQYHASQQQAEAAQKTAQEQHEAEMKQLEALLNTPEAKAHMEVLKGIVSGSSGAKAYLDAARDRIKAAGLTGVIEPHEAAQIAAYSGSYYGEVNKQLRAGVMTEEQWGFAQALNAALMKLPAYKETTWRKASLPPDIAAKYQVGKVIEEHAFTSSAKNSHTWSGEYVFTIHGKSGRDIQKLSSHQSEAEVLFRHGTRFKVKSRQGNAITLEEVDARF